MNLLNHVCGDKMKTYDLGLNIEQTADIPVVHYWTPEVIRFKEDFGEKISLVIVLENNSHRKVFKDAFKNKVKIHVAGSAGKNPCLWLTVNDHTIIVDIFGDDNELEIKGFSNLSVFFEDTDNTHIGVVKIKGRK